MANAKIISIVDHEVAAVLRLTAKDIEDARAQTVHDITAARHALTNAIADNTLTLRHDINTLAAAVTQLRQDVDKLSLQVMFNEFHDLSNQVSALRHDLDQLKQGGATP